MQKNIEIFYVYVLKSLTDGNFYTEFSRDIRKRLEQHNKGLVKSTKNRKPFKLVYFEGCLNQQDAAKREKYLKTSYGKRFIKNRIKNYLINEKKIISRGE